MSYRGPPRVPHKEQFPEETKQCKPHRCHLFYTSSSSTIQALGPGSPHGPQVVHGEPDHQPWGQFQATL